MTNNDHLCVPIYRLLLSSRNFNSWLIKGFQLMDQFWIVTNYYRLSQWFWSLFIYFFFFIFVCMILEIYFLLLLFSKNETVISIVRTTNAWSNATHAHTEKPIHFVDCSKYCSIYFQFWRNWIEIGNRLKRLLRYVNSDQIIMRFS